MAGRDLLGRADCLRVLASLVADELCSLRQLDGFELDASTWDEATLIAPPRAGDAAGTPSLEADSFERVALATRVARFFNLDEAGVDDYLLRQRTFGQWVDLICKVRQSESRDLTFSTSGSTGKPRLFRHRWHRLEEEAAYFASLLLRKVERPPTRLYALVPPHHIYGFLFTVLLPRLMGLEVIPREASLARAVSGNFRPDALVAGVPFLWEQLARSGREMPANVLGITSTGPCDPATIRQLCGSNLAAMLEIYGATDTGGIGWRLDPDSPFRLLPRWERVLPGGGLRDRVSGEAHEPPDRLRWPGDRALLPAGRKDQAVSIGGINVYPDRVARLLESRPGVRAARVRPAGDESGQRLKALVVPEPGLAAGDREDLARQLTRWSRDHLRPPERPVSFTIRPALPRNGMGKEADWSESHSQDRYISWPTAFNSATGQP